MTGCDWRALHKRVCLQIINNDNKIIYYILFGETSRQNLVQRDYSSEHTHLDTGAHTHECIDYSVHNLIYSQLREQTGT